MSKDELKKISIIGAGQLGSRYLQGLTKCQTPLSIFVQDISSESLFQAEQRWKEAGGPSSFHKISFQTEITQCPKLLDLAIISTSAHSRPEVVRKLSQHAEVRYWILEKVLAQFSGGLEEIQLNVANSFAWVNTPRRIIPWHQKIKTLIQLNSPLHLTVDGGPWGLACNAVHFLDLLAWWSGESLVEVCTDQLDDSWIEAKRAGYHEIYGTLTATFSGGSTAKLNSSAGESHNYDIVLTDSKGKCKIDESNGKATFSDGKVIDGMMPYQSELTSLLVEEILATGGCQLPTVDESVAIHQLFIDAMLKHWQRYSNPAATFVPIT